MKRWFWIGFMIVMVSPFDWTKAAMCVIAMTQPCGMKEFRKGRGFIVRQLAFLLLGFGYLTMAILKGMK